MGLKTRKPLHFYLIFWFVFANNVFVELSPEQLVFAIVPENGSIPKFPLTKPQDELQNSAQYWRRCNFLEPRHQLQNIFPTIQSIGLTQDIPTIHSMQPEYSWSSSERLNTMNGEGGGGSMLTCRSTVLHCWPQTSCKRPIKPNFAHLVRF